MRNCRTKKFCGWKSCLGSRDGKYICTVASFSFLSGGHTHDPCFSPAATIWRRRQIQSHEEYDSFQFTFSDEVNFDQDQQKQILQPINDSQLDQKTLPHNYTTLTEGRLTFTVTYTEMCFPKDAKILFQGKGQRATSVILRSFCPKCWNRIINEKSRPCGCAYVCTCDKLILMLKSLKPWKFKNK